MANSSRPRDVIAAIDIGTNAARLLVARTRPNGSLHVLRAQRDAIRPGEGVFRTGQISPKVAQRIVSTLKDFARTCRPFKADVRAVATSSFRDAKNGAAVRTQVFDETGIDVEIISGEEEARLICMAVLEQVHRSDRAMVIDIGGGSTEVTVAQGGVPLTLTSMPLGTVRLTELFDASDRVAPQRLEEMRAYARDAITAQLNGSSFTKPDAVYGSSGTIRSLASFVGPKKSRSISLFQLSRALDALAQLSARERRKHFEPSRADVIVSGAVVLESVMNAFGLASVTSVDRGLRDGILLDMLARRRDAGQPNPKAATA